MESLGRPSSSSATILPTPPRTPWSGRVDTVLDLLDHPFVIFLLLAPVWLRWLVPLFTSRFWLDEAVTWWATNGGFIELFRRCTVWPGSIAYNSIALFLRTIGVHQEWALRLPSLLAAAGSATLLFDLARRWFSKRVAISAMVFFCAQTWVSFAAADARPYAIALLLVVLATWLMMRWVQEGRTAVAAAYGVVAGLIPHFHMLFLTVLVFHAAFLAIALKTHRARLRQFALAAAIAGLVALPLLPQYLRAFHDRQVHTFPVPRSISELVLLLIPTIPMFLSALIASLLPRFQPITRNRIAGTSVLLAVLWATVPACLLFVAAKLTGSDLFVSRYALPVVPGLALCFGLILEFLSSRLRTGLVLMVFLMFQAMEYWPPAKIPRHTLWGDWGAAIEFVDSHNQRERLPALMRSGFPESDYWDWRSARVNDSALYAPLSYYASSTEWHPLPATFTPAAAEAIDRLIDQVKAAHQPGLFFLERQGEARQVETDPYVNYLRKRAGGGGELTEIGQFSGVRVYRFHL